MHPLRDGSEALFSCRVPLRFKYASSPASALIRTSLTNDDSAILEARWSSDSAADTRRTTRSPVSATPLDRLPAAVAALRMLED